MSVDALFDTHGLMAQGLDPAFTPQRTAMYRFGQWLTYKDSDKERTGRNEAKFEQELKILTYVEKVKDKEDTVIKEIPHPGKLVCHPYKCNTPIDDTQLRSIVITAGALNCRSELNDLFDNQDNKSILDLAIYIRAFYMAGVKTIALLYPVLFLLDFLITIRSTTSILYPFQCVALPTPFSWWMRKKDTLDIEQILQENIIPLTKENNYDQETGQ